MKAKQGVPWVPGRVLFIGWSSSLAEKLGDDGWVDYSGRVPQVVVILSDQAPAS